MSSARARRAAAARPGSRRRIAARVGVIALGVAILAGTLTLALSGGSGGHSAGASVTDPARFDLPRLQGSRRVRLADFRGKPTVVNFFASWCTQCDAELPGFSKISRELQGRVNFVGVNSLETGDPFFMPRRHHIEWWPLAADVGGAQASGLHDALCQCQGMPITAFYDATGKFLGLHVGAIPESDLRQVLHDTYGISS
jgi:thiol-disulfide isomerase/thioredoxin